MVLSISRNTAGQRADTGPCGGLQDPGAAPQACAGSFSLCPLNFTAVTAGYPANPSLPAVLSTIRHFFDIDESQAWDPFARVRLSKVAGLM